MPAIFKNTKSLLTAPAHYFVTAARGLIADAREWHAWGKWVNRQYAERQRIADSLYDPDEPHNAAVRKQAVQFGNDPLHYF